MYGAENVTKPILFKSNIKILQAMYVHNPSQESIKAGDTQEEKGVHDSSEINSKLIGYY